jgi:hypothetical protein
MDAYQRMQGPMRRGTLTARSFLASAYRAVGDLTTAPPCISRTSPIVSAF